MRTIARSARFLTVEEAAEVLKLGRTAAYAAAKRWRVTGGAEGIKVVVIGGSLRVPTPWLEELAGGPIDVEGLRAARARGAGAATSATESEPAAPVPGIGADPSPAPPAARRSDSVASGPQLDLFEPPPAS